MTAAAERANTDMTTARRAMIDGQLRVSGVTDEAVLAAIAAVPREDFVPEGLRAMAYIDRAVPLGDGRQLAAPLFYGRLLAEARPGPETRTLVVDAGSGYLAALVAAMGSACEVIDPAAACTGRKRGDFDLLLIDGAVDELPASLVARLRDGARVVTGLTRDGVTRLAAGCKSGGEIALIPLAEMGIPCIPEFARPKSWAF